MVEDVGYVPLYEASPNHQDNNDEYNQTLYLSVISRLCYCAVVGVLMVVALAACIITLSFLGKCCSQSRS